jgi:hypothetical protein
MLAIIQVNRDFYMNLANQSANGYLRNLSGAGHASLGGFAPPKNIPIVSLGYEVRALRKFHRFVASPAAASRIKATARRSAKNIDSWSSYLPAECVDMMVSLGWDRTT